jgi:hypoxanthine-DNA glycosylase
VLQVAFKESFTGTTAGFPPILGTKANILILGTLPSQQSLVKQQYYGHPRNAFWPIMGELFAAGPGVAYPERTQVLSSQGIAVWDVLKSGVRPGSMDAAINVESATPNEFGRLYAEHPELMLVCFNGQAAGRLFRALVPDEVQQLLASIRFVTMPSTSPAYAAMSFADKLERWTMISEDQ